ncbi:MAG: hypothetical protein K0Q50_2037 [Vampirovibrio sp.]|jgi:hypothetical protein|nr:hypothetical protein [Vampirovibrio sp.]
MIPVRNYISLNTPDYPFVSSGIPHKEEIRFGKVNHLITGRPAMVGYAEIDNFRSEKRTQMGYPLERINTGDENFLQQMQAQHLWPKSFNKAIKDYLGYCSSAYESTLKLLKAEIPKRSIACIGGKELYRGVVVPAELLEKVQTALKEKGHYGAKGMMHGTGKSHHGITSVSSLPEVANYFAAARSANSNLYPVFLNLKMNKANPGRIIVPKVNCFRAGVQPHVWHEMLLDRTNEYAVKRLYYSDTYKMYQMDVAVSTDMFARHKILGKRDKVNYWNSIFDDIKNQDDSIVMIDYSGTPTFKMESPAKDYRQTQDSDNNALVDLARDESKHEDKSMGTNHRFKVIRARDSTRERPHYLILPRACQEGNYQDLKAFLGSANDDQKACLLDTMNKLLKSVPPKRKPYNPEIFKINNGGWQRIPYFSIHYRPYG